VAADRSRSAPAAAARNRNARAVGPVVTHRTDRARVDRRVSSVPVALRNRNVQVSARRNRSAQVVHRRDAVVRRPVDPARRRAVAAGAAAADRDRVPPLRSSRERIRAAFGWLSQPAKPISPAPPCGRMTFLVEIQNATAARASLLWHR
jgi:hypothetical protein